MQYASGGDLHKWIQNNFEKINWNKQKISLLWQISEGYCIYTNIIYNVYL